MRFQIVRYMYLSKKEIKSPENIMKSAIQFQTLMQSISTDYTSKSDFIINTDQNGCEYRVNVSSQECIRIQVKRKSNFIGDLNKITHSYTAQYSSTKSGILLDSICLQESGNPFGVRIKEEVDELLKLCKNISVVCSKSGKLTSYLYEVSLPDFEYLYEQYLKTVLKPYVDNNPFLLILGEGKRTFTCNDIYK